MDKTPDVSRLCPECGHVLDVEKHPDQDVGETPLYALRCRECRWERLDVDQPTRELMSGEVRLLARIAALEDAQRWRVTAEEMPPVWVEVLGWWEGCSWSFGVAKWDGSQWWAEEEEENRSVRGPDRWQPLPGVPDAR